ncbi:MAG: hypothetical protein JWR09_5350 [Mucilaginibacter sp.]|nr:hypothetical protein [Mucilaginibacter sp.]
MSASENLIPQPKLFMLLLGCKPPGRHTEQHDIFFGIASSLRELVPEIQAFWPEPAKIHIDAWREVNSVNGYRVKISPAETNDNAIIQDKKLFFINLGGYQENKFAEQHYIVLAVKADKASAFKEAKETLFFEENNFGGNSHIDDKYGIDVDDIYQIEDLLSPTQKEKYRIEINPATDLPEDEIHLGYFKLSAL